MKERPIIFNAEMVRAILDGRKTQTRRVIKDVSESAEDFWTTQSMDGDHICFQFGWHGRIHSSINCPYGVPGDRLWVREAYHNDFEHDRIFYKADADSDGIVGYEVSGAGGFGGGIGTAIINDWKPSIHMPRWASRLNLIVTGVRVERVQEITDADSMAEGVGAGEPPDYVWIKGRAINKFRTLWNLINDKRGFGWDENPWVWVVEFEKEAT